MEQRGGPFKTFTATSAPTLGGRAPNSAEAASPIVLELRGVAAAGVYHLDAHGDVAPPLASKSDKVTSFAGGLGLALDIRLTARIVWTVEGSALALAPQPAIALLTNQYTFAPPFATASTGIGVDF
jgi:hypothetical protein